MAIKSKSALRLIEHKKLAILVAEILRRMTGESIGWTRRGQRAWYEIFAQNGERRVRR